MVYPALVIIGISAAAAYTGSYLISEKAALILGTIDESEVRLYVLNGLSFWISIGITSGQVLTGGLIYNQGYTCFACSCSEGLTIFFTKCIPPKFSEKLLA